MSLIKIQIDKVNNLSVNLTQNSTRVWGIKTEVSAVKGGIDYKISSRRNINSRLSTAIDSLNKIEQDLKKLNIFTDNSMDLYDRTEKKLVNRATSKFPVEKQSMNENLWELIKSGMGGSSVYSGSRIKLVLGDLKFELSKKNGRTTIKLVGGNPRDYQRYRDLLMQKFGGNPSDWKKGNYQRLVTRGIALYDPLYNNNTGFRDTMRRFGSNQADDLSNYVSHLGDSKGKIFVNSYKDTVKSIVTDFNLLENKSISKIAGKSLGILGTGIMVRENYNDSKNLKEFLVNTGVDVGFGAGATAAGAVVGSAIVPPVGTVLGAAAGAVINFAFNAKVIPPEDKSIVDVTKSFVNDPVSSTKKVASVIEEKVNGVGKHLDKIFW